MLTRDEVVQLILYLVVATVLMLASRARAETIGVRYSSEMASAELGLTSHVRLD
jgi:hypothetical protein